MSASPQTLNQYIGTDSLGNQTTIVAEDMTTACEVYHDQEDADPILMQCTKQNIKCVLPTQYVTFNTVVKDSTGGNTAATAGCTATPVNYTLAAGTTQIFTATAVEGWTFTKWRIDGVDVEGDEGTKAVALLTIPAAPTQITIEAVFTAN